MALCATPSAVVPAYFSRPNEPMKRPKRVLASVAALAFKAPREGIILDILEKTVSASGTTSKTVWFMDLRTAIAAKFLVVRESPDKS